MKLPIVDLFRKVDQSLFRKCYPKHTRQPSAQEIYFDHMCQASLQFREARLAWALMVGPSLYGLMQLIADKNDFGYEVGSITTAREVQDINFIRKEIERHGLKLSPAGLKDHMERRRPDWLKAWDKITGLWMMPPELTPDEIKHIEETANNIHIYVETETVPSLGTAPQYA